jgi:2'-5' RNA ligase
MRMFLAIELPAGVRAQLTQLQSQLSSRITKASFTRPENLHITLKFLGDVRDRELGPLVESLQQVRSSSPITLSATAAGCFPNRGPVRIIAAMFGGDEKALGGVHTAIEQRCQYLGFEREQRKYTPHATLARARPILPTTVREFVLEQSPKVLSSEPFDVRQFVLMRSTLKPTGAEYAVAARFPLQD